MALMMEAVNTSETSVNFYETTQHNIPEDIHIQDKKLFMQRGIQQTDGLNEDSTRS
jgi:hypothetical protein